MLHTSEACLPPLLVTCVMRVCAQVMPILINVLHQSKEEERKALVENLAALVTLLRQHLRKWLPDLLHLINMFWTSDTQLQSWLLRLISELAGESPVELLRVQTHLSLSPILSTSCLHSSEHPLPHT